MNATGCPTGELLLAYHTGELPESLADGVIAHLAQCPACQAIVKTFGEAEDSLIARLRRPSADEVYAAEPQCREFVARAKAMVEATLSNMAAEAGTTLGKRNSPAGPQPQDLPPTELFGGSASPAQAVPAQLREYRILEKLGAGGMGTVYKALHTKLDKLVALKILPAAAMQDAELVARFDREMKAVGKLEHPNVVRAMDAGCHEGIHFLVMEYVEGMDLAQIVKRCGPLRIADACEVVRQAALGLRHADEHALVHRDIKPSNLVLNPEGIVKILDLGLALLQTERMTGEEATGRGRAMGTIDYMAPEQVRDSHNVDIRADIYSLGCTFYRLLTGHAPFGGPEHENTFDKMMAHLSEPVPPIRQTRPDVPEQLAAVLERMVAKDRDARYAKPGQVVEDLKPFCPGCDLAGLLIRAQKGSHPHAAALAPLAAPAEEARGKGAGAEKGWPEKLPSPSGRGAGGEGKAAVQRPAPKAVPPQRAGVAPGSQPRTPPSPLRPPPRPTRNSIRPLLPVAGYSAGRAAAEPLPLAWRAVVRGEPRGDSVGRRAADGFPSQRGPGEALEEVAATAQRDPEGETLPLDPGGQGRVRRPAPPGAGSERSGSCGGGGDCRGDSVFARGGWGERAGDVCLAVC